MSWGATGILIIFGLFVLLMIINPNLSCFGKRIKSPFYPIVRRRQMKKRGGFQEERTKQTSTKKTKDYGFHLD